MTRTLAASNDP
jgi:hypothetical protein